MTDQADRMGAVGVKEGRMVEASFLTSLSGRAQAHRYVRQVRYDRNLPIAIILV